MADGDAMPPLPPVDAPPVEKKSKADASTTPADATVQPALDHQALDVTSMTQDEMVARLRHLEAQVATITTPTASGGDNFGPESTVWSDSAKASLYAIDQEATDKLGLDGAKSLFESDLEDDQEVLDYAVRGDKVVVVLNDASKLVADYKG